jgi:hypothetical protein
VPGSRPQEISGPIKKRLERVDSGENLIRMIWDNTRRAAHLFISPTTEKGEAEHWTFEARTGSWFPMRFANPNHNPIAMCVVDGNEAADRSIVLGTWNGWVNKFDEEATDDDGTPIESYVVMGPVNSPLFDDMMIDELLVDLGESSGAVTFKVYVGKTAEAALASQPVKTGTLAASRNKAQPIGRAGHSVYVRFESTSRWALERIRLRIGSRGLVRSRAS